MVMKPDFTCLLLMLIVLIFLTHSRVGVTATASYTLIEDKLLYSLIDIERLQVTSVNTSVSRENPSYSTKAFTNSSFSKPLTFYARFCFLNRQRTNYLTPTTIFALKYSAIYDNSSFNCTLSLQLATELTFVEVCESLNGTNLTNSGMYWNQINSSLEHLLASGANESQILSLFIKTNPLSIQACINGSNHNLPLFVNSSNVSLISPDIMLLDPESTFTRVLCAISWTLIKGQEWQHSCSNDNYTNCCLLKKGKSKPVYIFSPGSNKLHHSQSYINLMTNN